MIDPLLATTGQKSPRSSRKSNKSPRSGVATPRGEKSGKSTPRGSRSKSPRGSVDEKPVQEAGLADPRKEGWLMKRSHHFHVWRARWVTLWSDDFKEMIEASPDLRGTNVSESFPIATVLDARATEREYYNRPHCFVLDLFVGSEEARRKLILGTGGTSGHNTPTGSFHGTKTPPTGSFTANNTANPSAATSFTRGDSMHTIVPGTATSGGTTKAIKKREVGFQATSDADMNEWITLIVTAVQRWEGEVKNGHDNTLKLQEEAKQKEEDAKKKADKVTLRGMLDYIKSTTPLGTPRGGRSGTTTPRIEEEAAGSTTPGKSDAKSPVSKKDTSKAEPATPFFPSSPLTGDTSPQGKGKSKGKGKGPPPPSGPPMPGDKGDGKGKGKPPAVPSGSPKASLPFGKRMLLKDTGELMKSQSGEATIFDNLLANRDSSMHVEDIEVLQNVFQQSPMKAASKAGPKSGSIRKGSSAQKDGMATVLSANQAQNCSIILRTLPLKDAALSHAIEQLEPGPLLSDHTERLVEALPKAEQMLEIRALDCPEENIREIERTLRPLARIDRLFQHIRVIDIALKLDEHQETLMGQLQCVQTSCSELRASELLRNVLAAVLVMFNYVNFGNVGGEGARAFDIHSLVQLNQFKTLQGPFPNFTGLHFVVLRLLSANPDLTADNLKTYFTVLKNASETSLYSVMSAIEGLKDEAKFLSTERRKFPVAYGCKPKPEKKKPEAPVPLPRPELPPSGAAEGDKTPPLTPRMGAMKRQDSNQSMHSQDSGCNTPKKRNSVLNWIFGGTPRNSAPPTPGGSFNKFCDNGLVPVEPPKFSPAPGHLLMSESGGKSGTEIWMTAWVEVKAPGLLCYYQDDASKSPRQMQLNYIVLAGAEVVPFNSPLASLEAREAYDARPSGFELQNVVRQGNLHAFSNSSRIWFDAAKNDDAQRWCLCLKALASAPGAGFLWLHRGSGIWRWRWCILHCHTDESTGAVQSRLMVWYKTPGEFLRGEAPLSGARLNSHTEAESFIKAESKEAKRSPFGFRVSNVAELNQGPPITAEAGTPRRAKRGEIQGKITSLPKKEAWNSGKDAFFSASCEADMESWITLVRSGGPGGLVEDPEKVFARQRRRSKKQPDDIFALIAGAGRGDVSPHHSPRGTPRDGHRSSRGTPRSGHQRGDGTPRSSTPRRQDSDAPGTLDRQATSDSCSSSTSKGGRRIARSPSLRHRSAASRQQSGDPGERVATLSTKGGLEVAQSRRNSRSRRHKSPSSNLDAIKEASPRKDKYGAHTRAGSSASSSEASGDEGGKDVVLPIKRLKALERRVEAARMQMLGGHGATTAECRQMLMYFGQSAQDANPMLLAKQVQSCLDALSKFWTMLIQAFAEVQKQREVARRQGRPDFCIQAKDITKDAFGLQLSEKGIANAKQARGRFTVKQQLQAKRQAKYVLAEVVHHSMAQAYAISAVALAAEKTLLKEGFDHAAIQGAYPKKPWSEEQLAGRQGPDKGSSRSGSIKPSRQTSLFDGDEMHGTASKGPPSRRTSRPPSKGPKPTLFDDDDDAGSSSSPKKAPPREEVRTSRAARLFGDDSPKNSSGQTLQVASEKTSLEEAKRGVQAMMNGSSKDESKPEAKAAPKSISERLLEQAFEKTGGKESRGASFAAEVPVSDTPVQEETPRAADEPSSGSKSPRGQVRFASSPQQTLEKEAPAEESLEERADSADEGKTQMESPKPTSDQASPGDRSSSKESSPGKSPLPILQMPTRQATADSPTPPFRQASNGSASSGSGSDEDCVGFGGMAVASSDEGEEE